MLLGIFFLLRGREQIVFGIIVDLCYGQNFIIFIAFSGF